MPCNSRISVGVDYAYCRWPWALRRDDCLGCTYYRRIRPLICRKLRKPTRRLRINITNQWQQHYCRLSLRSLTPRLATNDVVHTISLGKQYPCCSYSGRGGCWWTGADAKISSITFSNAHRCHRHYRNAAVGDTRRCVEFYGPTSPDALIVE